MALNFVAPERKELTPRITVFGVGGAGGNAVNNMIDKNLEGVEFVVANTDAQALQQSQARSRIQLGVRVTEGLGAGARPSVGASAAEETLEEIIDHLSGAHMCFITAGMGGGTGTGAAPIIAQAAREMGVLTVGVVTKPFSFEGAKRMRQAEEGVEALQKVVDTLIIIPNQNLFRLANEKTTFTEAFALADDVLYQGVKGVTDLMVRPGMINLDFADVRAVMDEMGKAMMGTGEASGEDRARVAAEKAIANPLLDEISLHGAKGVLINITGGHDLTLFELDEAANLIREKVDPDANIIVGSTLDPSMEGMLRVSVVATGIESRADAATLEVHRRRLAEPLAAQHAPEHHQVEPVETRHNQPEPADIRYEQRPQAPSYAAQSNTAAPVANPGQDLQAGYRRHSQPQAQSRPQQDEFDLDEVMHDESEPATASDWRPGSHAAHAEAAAPRPSQPAPMWRAEPAWDPEPQHEPQQIAMRPSRGTPSPETLQRLRAAVEKQPDGRPEYPTQRSAPAASQAPVGDNRSRFGGLGSLIGRMTGQAGEAPPHSQPNPPQRNQPPVHSYDDQPAPREHDDRIEMPAFLRRQAN